MAKDTCLEHAISHISQFVRWYASGRVLLAKLAGSHAVTGTHFAEENERTREILFMLCGGLVALGSLFATPVDRVALRVEASSGRGKYPSIAFRAKLVRSNANATIHRQGRTEQGAVNCN